MNRNPRFLRRTRPRVGAVVLLAALICNGCGTKTGDVSGTVRYKGEPLPVGSVTFLGADKQPVGTAPITNGKYALTKVPVGDVTIIVTTPPIPNKGNVPPPPPPRGKPLPKDQPLPPFQPENQPARHVAIPAKYTKADESGLTYTVHPGPQEHNIELK